MWKQTFFSLVFLFFELAFAAPTALPTVHTKVLKAVSWFDTLSYPARVQSKINANVLAEADALVAKIVVPLGKSVRRNEPLMTLNHVDPIYHFKPLMVLAPLSGVISSVEVSEGSRVIRGQKLATITDPARVAILTEITSSDLPAIKPGLTGELSLEGDTTPHNVRVVGVSPQVDPNTGTATCELELKEKMASSLVPSGQVGRLTFKVRERKNFMIPESALIYRNEQTFARIVQIDTVKFIAVRAGLARAGQVEILSGLKEGMQLVVRSNLSVADGEKVNATPAESSSFE